MKNVLLKLASGLLTISTVAVGVASAAPWQPMPDEWYINFPPFLDMVDPIAPETIDKTPSMKFDSSEAGTITYQGDCTSSNTAAVAGENTITLSELAFGTYTNCSLKVTDSTNKTSAALEFPDFEVKPLVIIPDDGWNFAPFLTVITPVDNPTFDKTPEFTFKTSEAGSVTYEGDCSSATSSAVVGNNTIIFNSLSVGTHSNCKIKVKDATNLTSTLAVPEFEVKQSLVLDLVAPTLAVVTAVENPTSDSTPNFVFSSNEAGTIMYEGACSSSTTAAVNGNNTVTFAQLANGTYTDCKVKVKDSAGNTSAALAVPTFKVQTMAMVTCAGFTDVAESDASCDAIEYAKSIGAITGNPDGTFDKDGLLQRDQIAKIALEAFDMYDSSETYCSGSPFPDVTSSAWSYQYICRAKELNVVKGYEAGADAGLYRPGRSVNRVELLAIILRNLSDNMPSNDSSSYSDVATGQWFSGYAKYAKDNLLFVGSNLMPEQAATREEVAKILYRLHTLGKI
jgi:uncharacterized protein YuzB (UPF0349 family)